MIYNVNNREKPGACHVDCCIYRGTLAVGKLYGFWSGTTGVALPYRLPVLTELENELVMAAARLGATCSTVG